MRVGAWDACIRVGQVPAPARHAAGGFAGEHKGFRAAELMKGITLHTDTGLNASALLMSSIARDEKLYPLYDELLHGRKQSRFLTDYLDSKTQVVSINYDLSKIVEAADESEDARKIILPKLITEAKNIKDVIKDIYANNTILFNIAPRKFEELIAELLYKKGFSVELTKQTRDGGHDIIALSTDHAGMPLKYLVECKRYRRDRKVGIDIVRSFCDVIREHGVNRGIIFSTSYFTKDARDRQKAMSLLLDLKDHDDAINWVKDYVVSF